jgi:hypothetical protein
VAGQHFGVVTAAMSIKVERIPGIRINPDDPATDFSQENFVLNYRPEIRYVSPEPEVDFTPAEEIPPTVEEARSRTGEVIKGYRSVQKLADIAQRRIDNRVEAAGGIIVQNDPIQDSPVVAAIKRQFPGEDGSRITYAMYKKCLEKLNAQSEAPVIQGTDVLSARVDPLRTDFGGLSNTQGNNRAELSSVASQIIKPIDQDSFQKAAVAGIFKLMLPLIKDVFFP